jgi:PIN domain nuclease of toxin-antitoxin system
MRLLLDTHAFLWFVLKDAKLSAAARALILDPNNEVLLSPASCWEIAIKVSIGKYTLPEPFGVFMPREISNNQFDLLEIEVAHTAVVAALPFHHRDPFDRLLVAQALAEKIPLISADPVFDAYGLTRLW